MPSSVVMDRALDMCMVVGMAVPMAVNMCMRSVGMVVRMVVVDMCMAVSVTDWVWVVVKVVLMVGMIRMVRMMMWVVVMQRMVSMHRRTCRFASHWRLYLCRYDVVMVMVVVSSMVVYMRATMCMTNLYNRDMDVVRLRALRWCVSGKVG